MTEQQWIARARHGDADAFEQLVVATKGRCTGWHCGCGSAEDAREVTQDAFLAAWRGLPAFRGDSRFSSWLYRLTTNAAIDFLRREKAPSGEPPAGGGPPGGRIPGSQELAEQRAAGGPAKGAGSAVTGTPTGAAAAGGAVNELRRDRTGSVAGERHGEIPYQPGPPPAARKFSCGRGTSSPTLPSYQIERRGEYALQSGTDRGPAGRGTHRSGGGRRTRPSAGLSRAAATTGSAGHGAGPAGRYRSRPGGLACGYHEPGP